MNLLILVNGGWGNYGAWTPCSQTCGPGTSQRTRECNNPPPSNGGNPCQGNPTESQTCEIAPCGGGSVEVELSLLSAWDNSPFNNFQASVTFQNGTVVSLAGSGGMLTFEVSGESLVQSMM